MFDYFLGTQKAPISWNEACIIQFRQFARMFSVRGMKMIAGRRWQSERVFRDLWVRAWVQLPDPAIISVFGLVFST